MKVDEVVIPMPAGLTAGGVLIRPDGNGPFPGVIHFTDIGGIRPAHITMATQLADKGYTVLVPNLFYRTRGKANFQRPPEVSREEMMNQINAIIATFTPDVAAEQGSHFVDFLLQHAPGPLGVVGYCFAGALALGTAAARPNEIVAAASFHGGGLGPHLLTPQLKARLYCGHAVKDSFMPAEAIELFEAALKTWGGHFESETYDGAFHSWTVPDSPVYNAPQAARAFEKLTALFASTLQRSLASDSPSPS